MLELLNLGNFDDDTLLITGIFDPQPDTIILDVFNDVIPDRHRNNIEGTLTVPRVEIFECVLGGFVQQFGKFGVEFWWGFDDVDGWGRRIDDDGRIDGDAAGILPTFPPIAFAGLTNLAVRQPVAGRRMDVEIAGSRIQLRLYALVASALLFRFAAQLFVLRLQLQVIALLGGRVVELEERSSIEGIDRIFLPLLLRFNQDIAADVGDDIAGVQTFLVIVDPGATIEEAVGAQSVEILALFDPDGWIGFWLVLLLLSPAPLPDIERRGAIDAAG